MALCGKIMRIFAHHYAWHDAVPTGVDWIFQTKPKIKRENQPKIRKEMLVNQVFPFAFKGVVNLCYFPIFSRYLCLICPFFVPRFLYLCSSGTIK